MADDNFFLAKYGAPQDESTPAGAANVKTQQASDDAQNYFLDQYGPAVDADNFKPGIVDNTPTLASKTGALALEAGKGLVKGTAALGAGLDTFVGSVPVLLDKLHNLISGTSDTTLQDKWYQNFVDPAVRMQQQMEAAPSTGFAGKAVNSAASTLETIAQMVVTGGEVAPELSAGEIASQGVTRAVTKGVEHGIKSATVPAVASAVNKGRDVYQQTGDAKTAIEAAQADYLTNAIGAIAPMSVAGGLIKRAGSGAVSGAVTGELGREMQNAALPDKLQQPFSAEDATLNTMSGAILGTVMGPRAESTQNAPAPSGPIDAVHSARDQVASDVNEKSVLPEVQARARAETAARGGDTLDQEVAAAMATLQHTEMARHLMLKDSQDRAFSDAEAQDNQARQEIQQKAAADYEMQQTEATKKQADVDDAFREISTRRLQETHKEELEAYAQREEQKGADLEQQAPYAPERATTRLGDVAPEEVKALAVPEPATEPVAPTETTPPPKPLRPLDLRLRKPVDPGDGWEITVHDKTLSTYSDEKTARKTLATMRQALAAQATAREAVQPSRIKLAETLPTEAGPLPPEKIAEPVAGDTTSAEQVAEAAKSSAFHPDNELPTPTEAQYRAQNYPMGHTDVQGIPVTIEHPAGSERPLGGPLKGQTRTMPDHYGYFKGTVDADGQHTDVVVGEQPDAPSAFVIDHLTPGGQYEQHKVMMGFPNELAARRSYKKIYPDRPQGPVTEMSVPKLKEWLAKHDTSAPLKPDEIKPPRVDRPEKAAARGLRFAEPINMHDALSQKYEAVRAEREKLLEDHSRPMSERNPKIRELSLKMADIADRLYAVATVAANAARARFKEMNAGIGRGNNASGESSASLEAIHRVADEKANGQGRYLVDPHGNATPLHGVDSVDAKAPPGHIIVQRGIGAEPYSILDRGGLPQLHARGLLNRARSSLDTASESVLRFNNAATREADTDHNADRGVRIEGARSIIQPLLDHLGPNHGVTVHDRPDSLSVPHDLKDRMRAANQMDARGVYDPDTDTVHIFAGNHENEADVMRTAIHEIVAHKGLRHLLGDKFESVMHDIHDNASRAWIDDFMRQHGLDENEPEHRTLAAEEYAAHLSEDTDATDEPPSVLRNAIDAIRKILRKFGVVKKWTDADIRALLRDSKTGLVDFSPHAKANPDHSDPLKYAENPRRDARVIKDSAHPLSQLAKYGATVEAQRNNTRSFVRSRLEALKDFGQNHIETLLKAIPRRNLPDFIAPGKMDAMRDYVRTANRMDGRRNELLTQSEAIGKNWNRYVTKNKTGGRLLGEMMHASTLAGVDPSREYKPQYSGKNGRPLTDAQRVIETQRRQQYAALKGYWNKMDEQGKQIFQQVRDHYQDRRRDVENGLMKRIQDSAAAGATKTSLMDQLRQQFEAGRVQEPYFPLARFGGYWAVANNEDGETASFSRFESPSEQRQWKEEMGKQGFDVDGGKKMEAKSMMQRIDPKFVAHIADHLNQVDPKLADDVWQHFLRNMPEMSMRKAFIHRQGRLGFTADALRAFGNSTFHSAHQIAKLENVYAMEGHLTNMETQARTLEMQNDPESHWGAPLMKEMRARHEWAMQPQASSMAAKLTALGHFWYLGTSPAHAFIFATQNPMVAYPTLAAKHGWGDAGREMTRAMGQYAGSRGPLGNRLRGDERAAFDEAQRIGLFSRTNAYTLLGVRDAGEGYNPNSVWTKAKEVSGYLLHKTDEMNRQTTYLAAYRLARNAGMSHNDAILHAEDMTWDSHFDYSNANRPALLQSNMAKVVFLFRQYMTNLVYRVARDARNGFIPGDSSSANTPALRGEARQRFAGILGQLGLMAGATGMPMYWAVESIVNAVMGDKDKPYDMSTAVRAHLTQQLGPTASKAVMDGPFDALTGATLSSRVELNHLWLKDTFPELDGTDKFLHLLGEAAGPIGSMTSGVFGASKLAGEGQYERAIESLAPKVLRDQMKAVRFAREGAVNPKGDTVMDKNEFTPYDIFLQSMGFTPSKLQTRYEQNSAVKLEAEQIETRRSLLMNRLFLAAHNDDAQGTQEAMDDITHFNGKNPGVAIRADNIVGAARARARMSAENVNGLHVNPGLSGLRGDMNFETQNPAQEAPAP